MWVTSFTVCPEDLRVSGTYNLFDIVITCRCHVLEKPMEPDYIPIIVDETRMSADLLPGVL